MAKGLLAKKLGMTRLFDENGKVIPVTILRAGPCTVTQIKTLEKEKYDAVQLGFEPIRPKLMTKARLKHLEKKGLNPFRVLKEFRNPVEGLEVGQVIKADVFAEGEIVKVTGISKGKGFQGVIKRHGFHGGRKTHGSHFHRKPGSLGPGSDPSRVFKGKKLPGQMGAKKATALNLTVVKVDTEKNLLLIKGAVPGANTSIVCVEAITK